MEAVFIDTHVLIWLFDAKKDLLSPYAAELVEKSRVLISPMVVLELGYLREIGRIGNSPQTMCDHLAGTIGLKVVDDSFEQIVGKALSIHWTRDVFDRLIVAHALFRNIPLLSKDRTLRSHKAAVWTCPKACLTLCSKGRGNIRGVPNPRTRRSGI